MTVKELIDEAAKQIQETDVFPIAGRERALAVTKLQEAQMWYTRGRAIEEQKFNPQDLDK